VREKVATFVASMLAPPPIFFWGVGCVVAQQFSYVADFANIVVLQRISIRGVVTTVDRRMVTGHAGCTYILVYRVKPCALFGRARVEGAGCGQPAVWSQIRSTRETTELGTSAQPMPARAQPAEICVAPRNPRPQRNPDRADQGSAQGCPSHAPARTRPECRR